MSNKPPAEQQEYVILVRDATMDDGPGRALALIMATSSDDAMARFRSMRTLPDLERRVFVSATRAALVMNKRERPNRSWRYEARGGTAGWFYSEQETTRKASSYLSDLIARRRYG